jgi:hypothetical protein
VGTDEGWADATENLRAALEAEGSSTRSTRAAARSTGPKIDVKVRDAIGRSWQLSTIQYDFNMADPDGPRVRRRGRRPPHADHAPPGAVRLGGAVLRRAPRALRRGLPHVARAGAGAGAARARRPRRLRRGGGRPSWRPTGCASTWSMPPRSSATGSARPRARRSRTCSWWATTTSPPHRRREPPRGRGRARRPARRVRRPGGRRGGRAAPRGDDHRGRGRGRADAPRWPGCGPAGGPRTSRGSPTMTRGPTRRGGTLAVRAHPAQRACPTTSRTSSTGAPAASRSSTPTLRLRAPAGPAEPGRRPTWPTSTPTRPRAVGHRARRGGRDPRCLPARRGQRRHQPRGGRRGRRARPPPRALPAALERRHELHDRWPRPACSPSRSPNRTQARAGLAAPRLSRTRVVAHRRSPLPSIP